jgi:hypothetical protein
MASPLFQAKGDATLTFAFDDVSTVQLDFSRVKVLLLKGGMSSIQNITTNTHKEAELVHTRLIQEWQEWLQAKVGVSP